MKQVEAYILKQKEPYQTIMIHVWEVILKELPQVKEKLSYGLPFYHYRNKSFLYMNVLRGTTFVDVGFMRGTVLKEQFPELQDYNNRKQVRSYQISSLEDFDQLRFVEILKAAAKLVE